MTTSGLLWALTGAVHARCLAQSRHLSAQYLLAAVTIIRESHTLWQFASVACDLITVSGLSILVIQESRKSGWAGPSAGLVCHNHNSYHPGHWQRPVLF